MIIDCDLKWSIDPPAGLTTGNLTESNIEFVFQCLFVCTHTVILPVPLP